MNHIYRLIWNADLLRWVVVPEVAKRHGKPSSVARTASHRGFGAIFDALRRPPCSDQSLWRLKPVLCYLLALQQVFVPTLASAQSIVADGRTVTTVTTNGAITNVTTGTVRGANAFNSFQRFGVAQGNTANLFLPNGTLNLINLVRDQRTTIDGILNAIKDGRIGGNVYFANPNGFLISASGIVNVGSLSLSTPTPAFIDNFFTAPGNPNEASVNSLLGGTAARNTGAAITVLGQVNAIDGIALSAGAINVGGTLYSGARFIGSAPDFADVVNANGLIAAANVVEREGRIEIVADGDVSVSGIIATPGGSGVRGGDIDIRAGGNVGLQAGALITARGNGDASAGGTVNIWADNDAVARSGALVDASAGSSGDGGFIEFSARNTLELAGGEFRADGTGGGQGGSVLIDPINLLVSADILRGTAGYGVLPEGIGATGANLTLQADNTITVNENVTISTRSVAGTTAADHASGSSTGNSGDLRLEAVQIALKSGSKLLAGANNGHVGGDVTLTASQTTELVPATAGISMDSATITGRDVSLTANATYNDSFLTSWLPVVVPVAVSSIDVKSGLITASGTLNVAATSLIDVSSSGLSPLGSIVAVSTAGVDVSGASELIAGGNTTLASRSTVTAKATPGGPNLVTLPGDAGVAINVIVSTAKTHLGDTSAVTVNGGTLDLTAKNAVTATTAADASAGGAVAVGGTLALSEVTSVTQALIDGSATTSSSALSVAAESTNVVTTSAKAATQGAKKQTTAEKGANASESEAALVKYKDQTTTSDGSVEVAAAVAIANVNSITRADIASTGTQTASGAATVASKASNSSIVTADGSSAGGTVGVGAAVGVNIGVLVNQARVADNARVSSSGLTVSAVMPTADGKNSFVTTATSGAGASNVGVAGALGTNVLVNSTVAVIEGDKDNNGSGAAVNVSGGDVVVDSANTSESKLTVGASVKPASGSQPAAVGVGASVGINVGVNTTVAEVGNGAGVSNAKDLDLTAKGTHGLTSEVTGGAAGADISVTPVAAINVAVNTTTARLGTGGLLSLTGAYASSAEQTSSSAANATGQTQGNNVAVGASIALNNATDTVTAEIDRDVAATGHVAIGAQSSSTSSASATASVAGGEKASAGDTPPAKPDGSPGKTVDQKVTAQGDAAKIVGKNTAAAAPADASPATADTASKLDGAQEAPKTEDNTQSGGVSVAAAVGVNTGIATTLAKVGKGRTITSTGGALQVTSANETDTSAKADGSQVDSGNTSVGVGAAVALNAGISTNVAVVGDDALVDTKGLTVSAVNVAGEKSDAVAEAKSGAGAGNVGVAGSLAASVVVNTTVAALEGDVDGDGTGATVDANDGDILIEAANATTSTVKSGAEVEGTGGTAKVGVGASIGVNVGVNTTVAEVADKAVLTGGKDFGLNATTDHTLTTDVTGGASGAKVAVTPLVAVTIAVNTTTARLGAAATDIGISGQYSSTADHQGSATTTATGQTQGNSVAVGASIGLTVATDTVVAEIERDVTADDGVEVNARSVAKSSTSATASVAGGEKAKEDGTPAAPDGGSGSGQTVDEKVAGQQGKATDAGKATAAKAPATTPAAGGSATDKLDESKNNQPPPKGETSEGGVAVAAAVGVNVGVATTVAKVGKGRQVTSSGGALKVTSANETDTSAKADGSQIDSGKTNVGVGAAVALNVGVATTTAVVADEAVVRTQGLTISATGISGEKSDAAAEAKSGAGAGNVGVAGALAINVATNTTVARLEGDSDSNDVVADVDAGGGAVLIEAGNATTSSAKVSADVKGTDDSAKVGVGASVGVNVAVNSTVAEVADKTKLINAGSVGLNATAAHAMTTEATGGAAGAKVSVTPVVAAGIAVNTTVARLGEGATQLDANGAYSSKAEQTSSVTTKATGQAQGDVAVGASLGATIAVDNVHATVERNLDAGNGIELAAKSDTSLTTEVKAGAKGAKAAKKDVNGNETPEAGTTVDEQKTTQLDFAKGRNAAAAGVDTTTPEAKTPDTTEQAPGTDKPTSPPNNEKQGKKVSVAAAIGATVAYNQAKAEIAAGKTVGAGSGKLEVAAESDTNYRTLATGEAVSDDVGVAAAVALTATYNKTLANIGTGATVSDAGAVEISATSRQNRGTAFQKTMSAEAVSGASGGEVAVAGSLALVGNWNETRASIDEGVTIGSSGAAVGDVTVAADETSKVAAQARAGALSKGEKSKAGVGASFAVLLSYNQNTAAVGYDANKNGSYLPTAVWADSLTVSATKNRVRFLTPTLDDAKNFVVNDITNLNFDALDPSTYLGSNNYYTEAVAGAAAKGNAAVAGAFAVNVFGNTTEAYLGESVHVTATGKQPAGEQLGVEVAARSDTQAVSFAGAVAGAKKAGVGITATSIVNLDQTLATIGKDAVVKSNADGAGVKLSAYARQDIANVGVGAALATEGAGVTGVLGAIVSLARTEAKIGDNAEVKSQGDVDVEATGDITAVSVSGGVAGGKSAGVGASIAGNVLANQTRAGIGDNAKVAAKNDVNVAAVADELAITAVVAGAGGEKAGVAGAISANVIVGSTEAVIGQGAQINTDAAYDGGARNVAITARDDTVVVGIAGGGAGGGKAGVGAALDTTVLIKTVKAYVEDDTDGLNVARVNADRNVQIDASASEVITSVAMGFAGGGNAGVGGAVAIAVNKNDVQAGIGQSAIVDSAGNVLVNAQDDVSAVLTAGAGAGGGDAGVGGSLAVATLLGSSKAYVGEGATVNARGNADAADVYVGETVIAVQSETPVNPGKLLAKKTESAKGLAVTAYNRENLVTTVVGGAGGGTAGVAATVSANVIANTTEASIGRGAKINEFNTAASAEQQVRVKAIDETLLINTAGAGAGGGTAGVGAAANVGVVAKTTQAWIGRGALVNAKQAVELAAASSALTFSTTAGLAGGGSAGVGGAVAGVGVANTTMAYVEDGTSAANAAKINVSGGDLRLNASDLATSWLVTGAGAGGGAAGVGGSLSVGVNASTTKAKIGDYAETNASGTTEVHADSTENVNTITIAGAGGGSAGVAGSISVNVVVSKTEAGIGDHAEVNQDGAYAGANQNVDVKATDRIITVGAAGAGAGGGAAGVGGSAVATVALNTTSAYIGSAAKVAATKDVTVAASSEKTVNSAAVAGAGGGAAGVAGAVAVIAVGSLLDGEAKSGLQTQDEGGNSVTTQSQADGQTTKSAVGGMLGDSSQSIETKGVLDSNASKLAVSQHMAHTTTVPLKNTQAFIGYSATVKAGRDVTVTAKDTTLAINANGAGAGGGAAGVAGSLGVTLLHDSAEAFIANGAKVDADRQLLVNAETGEIVVNIGVTGYGGGAAGVGGSGAVNVVTSNTSAYIGDADINQEVTTSTERSVEVKADSNSKLIAVAGSGGGAGAAAVGGVLNVNTLTKDTRAFIGEGAAVKANTNVIVSAESAQNIISAGISIQGAGAAAVGGAATVNVVANTTEAFIGSARDDSSKTAAVVDSDGNVVVAAADDTLVVAVAGSGTGAGAAAVGGAVGANVISSQTRAYVGDNSVINARGNAAGASIDSGTVVAAGAMPPLPSGVSGDIDADRDGAKDGDVSNGASFTLAGGSASTGVNPSTVKDSQGAEVGNATGGLGARGKETATGLAVTASGNQKIVSAAMGVAGAGAAGVTGTATADVIISQTAASIGDGAQINQSGAAGTGNDVRVRAADNSLVVMASGTIAGAGVAAVSGSANAAVIAKQTQAVIGDADIKARDVAVEAGGRDDVYIVTVNASVGGAAGVGAAAGVGVIANQTLAGIKAGATIDATRDIKVAADQTSSLDIYTVSGAGGIVGVSGAFSVGVIDNTTRAYVEGGTSAATAATLDAGGKTEVAATSTEEITTGTVSAAGGGVGVAGAVGVKVVTSETTAEIGNYTKVNQTRRGGATQDVQVAASDNVRLKGGSGAGGFGGYGAGATADVNVVRNTTTAAIGNHAKVRADDDIGVAATSTKDVQSAAVAAAGGASAGIAGAVALAFVGASIQSDSDAKSGIGNGATAAKADEKMKADNVSSKLGDSEHVQGTKTELATRSAAQGVSGELNDASTTSRDKTRAYVGSNAQLVADGKVEVTATDRTQLDLRAVGAAGGAVGIGAAVGVGITHSTTEAFVDASSTIDADGDVTVAANALNVNANGSKVESWAGAGGVVGLSASVAVLKDTSTTRSYLANNVNVIDAARLSVEASTDRRATTATYGASVGIAAIGASVAVASFKGATTATLGTGVQVDADAVQVSATDDSVVSAYSRAGSAGIVAGSGSVATAEVTSTVTAELGDSADIDATGDIDVLATSRASTKADAIGINIGAGAVGASVATATSGAKVYAKVGENASISGASFDLVAKRDVKGSAPTAQAHALGAAGGLLLGANGTVATAKSTGETVAAVGTGSTITTTGIAAVKAENASLQSASAFGVTTGLLALGANFSHATSDSLTQASLGNNVAVSGGGLQVSATGNDSNYSFAKAGAGGLLTVPYSAAFTNNTSRTYAMTGSGDATRMIDVGSFYLGATQTSNFDSWIESTVASLVGVSGAKAKNTVNVDTQALLGTSAWVEADSVTMQAGNTINKGGHGAKIPGTSYDTPGWNVVSSSGGLADVPAAESLTTIVADALLQVGSGAHLEQNGSSGDMRLDAWSNLSATDKVKMASGGAVSAASGKSSIMEDVAASGSSPAIINRATASVVVAPAAELLSDGDMALGARSQANVYSQVAVDVYGLVGVAPEGTSVARFKGSNRVEIGAAASLTSARDIRLSAGENTSGNGSSYAATARTDVFNNTAIPVNRDPVADAFIVTSSLVKVAASADVAASRHISLYADTGSATASGVGVGKDIYRETLAAIASAISQFFGGDPVSFETRTGRSVKSQQSEVAVDGSVRTGINRLQELEIDKAGVATVKAGDIHVVKDVDKGIASDLIERIEMLESLISDYEVSGATGQSSIAVAAYKSEINFLKKKLKDMGFQEDPNEPGFYSAPASTASPYSLAEERLNAMTTTRTGYETKKTDLVAENTSYGNQIAANNTKVSNNHTSITTKNQTIAANTAKIATLNANDDAAQIAQLQADNQTLQQEIGALNAENTTITTVTNPGLQLNIDTNVPKISSLGASIVSLTTEIDSFDLGSYSTDPFGEPTANFKSISDATAQLGNVYVRGNRLTGSGTLEAPGDAQIKITNNSDSYLILHNLSIASNTGGKIYFNGVDVNSNDEINNVNGGSGAALALTTAETQASIGNDKPKIEIISNFNPLAADYLATTDPEDRALAPDIILRGDIKNENGLVRIKSEAGSIRLEQKRDYEGNLLNPVQTASIRANEVELSTKSGDFVQSYTDSFYHVAGRGPIKLTEADEMLGTFDSLSFAPEVAGSGIVANGSVFIAARYLNINGIVQSGMSEWGVTIPANAAVTIGGGAGSFADALAHYAALSDTEKAAKGAEFYAVSGATVSGLTGNKDGDWQKVDVFYNAKENRLELSGVQVQGGYIELFGQIVNTNANGGELRVLDGYGKIKVENKTNLGLVVSMLDSGRDVKGQISITNILGVNPDGSLNIQGGGTQVLTRGNGSRDGGNYELADGMRYAMQVGFDNGTAEYYRYSRSGWFDIASTFSSLALDKYRLYSAPPKTNPMLRGEYLITGSSITDTTKVHDRESLQISSQLSKGASWKSCNWWTLCANATYYQEFSLETKTKEIDSSSVAASNPIKITYIGYDQGSVSIDSVGSVLLAGSLSNLSGHTAITSSQGSITQNTETVQVSGRTIELDAKTGIGSAEQSLRVNARDSGRVDATTETGDVRIREMLGDFRVGIIGGANVANVVLEADRNMVNADASSYVQGQRVELLSTAGGIGADGDPLRVRTAYSSSILDWPSYGLKATARDTVNIRNEQDVANAATYSGNLLLIAAESLAGDVRIETSGSVIDNNPIASVDVRSQADLAALWDDLRLRGDKADDKANEMVAAYKQGKEVNYALYWKMRASQADGGINYNADYRLTTAERSALAASGMMAAEIDTFEANRRTQYQQLHTDVGGLTASYQTGYKYAVSTAEDAQIRNGSKWTDAQLHLSVGAGLLKNITDTVTTIKEPNAKGRSVTLIAGENIGSYNPPVTIDLSDLDALSIEDKAALAAAERGDASHSGNFVTIVQPRPVNVAVGSGVLNAIANTGYALIGSEQDLRINRVISASDVRIKTAGALINAAAPLTTNVRGNNIILEAASGGIGEIDSEGEVSGALLVEVDDELIARAAADIWIEATGDLKVDTVYSRADLRLDAQGSILDAHTAEPALMPQIADINLRARNIELSSVTGSIGEQGNELDVGVNRDGFVSASAPTFGKGVYLNAPGGEYFNIGTVVSGDAVTLRSATDMKIDGAVTGPGPFTIQALGAMTLTPHADLHATTLGVFLRANSLEMQDAQRMLDNGETVDPKYVAGDAARMRVDAGTIDIETVGDARITGIETGNQSASAIRVVSAAGRIFDNGDTRLDIMADTAPAAQLTISAPLGIGANPLDVRILNLLANSDDGVVDLAVEGSVNILGLTAGDRVLLTAGGDITGNSVTSGALTGSDPENPATGVTLASASGLVNLASISSQQGVNVSAPTAILIDQVNVGTSLFLASKLISGSVTGTGAGSHGGAITGFGGVPANNVSLLLSSSDAFHFSNFSTMTGSVNVPLGNLWVDNMYVGARMTVANPQTNLLIDQVSRGLQGYDVQLYSGGAPFALGLVTNHVQTDSYVIGRRSTHEVISPNGNNTSAQEAGEDVFRQNRRDVNGGDSASIVIDDEIQELAFEVPAVSLNDSVDGKCAEGDEECKER